MEKVKQCLSCKDAKPFEEFHKRNKAKDGLSTYCKTCKSITDKVYRELNNHLVKQKKAEYYQNNKNDISIKAASYYNSNKELVKQRAMEWKTKNKYKHNMSCMVRYTQKMNACPSWVDKDQIRVFYKIAACLQKVHGVKYHVDHIVPLQGINVSGLHVPWNLQVITASENCSKRNKHD